jgi:outer membrane lipoprotein-sorting protein
MKLLFLILPVAIAGSSLHISSADSVAGTQATTATFDCSFGVPTSGVVPQKSDDPAGLDGILKKMDSVSTTFRSAQAEFQWDNYQRVIDEVVDVQTGTIYYRRQNKDIEMMADVKKAGASAASLKSEPKYVLFADGKVKMYQPKTDQVTVYDLGKDRADLESYVVLGFGGSGQDLQKAFDVKYQGTETVNGVSAAKLELTPKSERVRKNYNRMILWIDPDRGVSVQQEFFTPQGDYRLCKYSSIKLNEKIGDDVFKLKTTGKTQVISPKG